MILGGTKIDEITPEVWIIWIFGKWSIFTSVALGIETSEIKNSCNSWLRIFLFEPFSSASLVSELFSICLLRWHLP